MERAEAIRASGVDPSVDNFLKITNEARLLGTDARLLERDAPNNPDSKLNKVVENVAGEYFANNKDGKIGCQLVFFRTLVHQKPHGRRTGRTYSKAGNVPLMCITISRPSL